MQTRRLYILIIFLFMFSACENREGGKLIYVDNDPLKGFHFPYFLFIPDGISPEIKTYIIVEPNNTGFASDDFSEHVEKAKRRAMKDFYIGKYIAGKLKYPLLIPVFPRPKSDWKIYTHALDRDAILQKHNALERIDLQLMAMIADAQKRLKDLSYHVEDKVLMTGFSASGTFANRFTLLHPEVVKATAAGGLNGLLMLPVVQFDNMMLDYPIGVHDFNRQFGHAFDSTSFRQVPQFLFMGELDKNDAIPFEDGYEPMERDLIFKILGKQMQPERWNKCREIYQQQHINARIVTFPAIGHDHPEKVKEEILAFFKECLSENKQ